MTVFLVAMVISTCIVIIAWLTLRVVHRELGFVVEDVTRMRHFDFEPAPASERFIIADFKAVRDSLEQGKMAIRAMRKYVPITLLRQLYKERKEVFLWAEPVEISMLFSDIRDFTTLSENLSGDDLARALGLYLGAMARGINEHQGTIDKYIGDSVMAFWNAPLPIENDARRACRAALQCVRECDQLFASSEWGTLPRWVTRYGIHRDRVMVGNFGSPDRMNYTAMGDGVNTASRLEGLNKTYGTLIMVSEVTRDAAADEFVFRKLDLVAVKGKSKHIAIFELLGAKSDYQKPEFVNVYESALESYLAREFSKASALLRNQIEIDAPSNVLYQRCLAFEKQQPPLDWNGVFIAHTK
jgi:adenylate cyclase